jgi:hypothetical protein
MQWFVQVLVFSCSSLDHSIVNVNIHGWHLAPPGALYDGDGSIEGVWEWRNEWGNGWRWAVAGKHHQPHLPFLHLTGHSHPLNQVFAHPYRSPLPNYWPIHGSFAKKKQATESRLNCWPQPVPPLACRPIACRRTLKLGSPRPNCVPAIQIHHLAWFVRETRALAARFSIFPSRPSYAGQSPLPITLNLVYPTRNGSPLLNYKLLRILLAETEPPHLGFWVWDQITPSPRTAPSPPRSP